jgi:hypothetical protein
MFLAVHGISFKFLVNADCFLHELVIYYFPTAIRILTTISSSNENSEECLLESVSHSSSWEIMPNENGASLPETPSLAFVTVRRMISRWFGVSHWFKEYGCCLSV